MNNTGTEQHEKAIGQIKVEAPEIEYEHWIDMDGTEHSEPICIRCHKMGFEEETTFTAAGPVCCNCIEEEK